MAQKTILIKKYENRRLYDSTNSRYVNLDEVAQILQRGDDVRVVDAASGEDITRLILTQIIVEDAKTPDSNFPLDVLRQMVVASGRASQESALKYMKAMLDIYQNTYRVMAPPINPFEFVQQTRTTRDTNAAPAAEAASGQWQKTAREPKPDDVEELKERLAELEKLVSALAPEKASAKRRSKAKS
jgi:polyhydroxyalkanoate synthesis repressor PhaR